MPPPSASKTVWELNGILATQDTDFDGFSQGLSYPHVALPADVSPELFTTDVPIYPPVAQQPLVSRWTGFPWFTSSSSSNSSSSPPPCSPQHLPCDWHPHRPWLAAADGSSRVHIMDMAVAEVPVTNGRSTPAEVNTPRLVLQHALQPQVCSVAWAPHHSSQLAVGTLGGVALWNVSGGPRPPLPGLSTGRPMGPWVSFIPARGGPKARVTGLAWSPDGQFLAMSSCDSSGMLVVDLASGCATPVGAGPAPLSMLRWSPCGSYLFAAASSGGRFFLWETTRWSHQSYDTPQPVAAAVWVPHQPLLLMAVAGSSSLLALHVISASPSLTVQLLPVTLPDLFPPPSPHHANHPSSADAAAPAQHSSRGEGSSSWASGGGGSSESSSWRFKNRVGNSSRSSLGLEGSGLGMLFEGRGGGGASDNVIQDLALDPLNGGRLAVLLKSPHPSAGCVALYSLMLGSVVHLRFVGFVRPPPARSEAQSIASGSLSTLQVGGAEGVDSANEVRRNISAPCGSISMHRCFTRGALLTLRIDSAHLYNVPLYF